MSLKRRRIQRPSATTRCETEPLSAPANAKPAIGANGVGERRADHAAVDDRHDPLAGVGGGDAIDRRRVPGP